jgi:dipeptidyl aminopeptidase/acylaminoacyl peptidase
MPGHSLRFPLAVAAILPMLAGHSPATEMVSAEIFAQQPVMTGASLSPDGTQVAFLSSLQGRYHLVIERFSPEFSRSIVAPTAEFRFLWAHWVSNDRLVICGYYSGSRYLLETAETRLLSVDSHGQQLTPIIKPGKFKEVGSRIAKEMPTPQLQDNVVDWLPDDPDHILVAIDADHDYEFEVRRVDVRTGDYEDVVGDFAGHPHWLADLAGEVRLGWGNRQDDKDNTLSVLGADGWTTSADYEWMQQGYTPLAFTHEPGVILVQGPNDAGLAVIRKLRLDTGEFIATVFQHAEVDAGDIVLDEATAAPVGTTYTLHLPAVEYFDPEYRTLQATIDKALPDTTNRIASTSRDHRRILILSFSDTDPGEYRIWDRDAKSLSLYGNSMRNLGPDSLAPVTPVSYKARDGLTIPAYLTIPSGVAAEKLPTVVLPHGGPSSRDDASYFFLSQFLASRGYAVLQPNFRGSSGYGKPFADAGLSEWGGRMQDDVTDGTRWLVTENIADPLRICIVGWSYGGYAAAMGAVQAPDLYRCAASINGVLNLPLQIVEDKRYVGGSEWTRHMGLADEKAIAVSPYHLAERITVPMLVVQAADDTRVHKEQGRGMAERLQQLGKPVQYVEVESGGHAMLNEEARARILSSLETFLATNLGPGRLPK